MIWFILLFSIVWPAIQEILRMRMARDESLSAVFDFVAEECDEHIKAGRMDLAQQCLDDLNEIISIKTRWF